MPAYLKIPGQLLILCAFYATGELAHRYLIPMFPGAVLGLLLLFTAFCLGLVKPTHIQAACDLLLRNMSFLFVPLGVGLMANTGLLAGHWVGFLMTIALTTFLIWATTALTVEKLRRRSRP